MGTNTTTNMPAFNSRVSFIPLIRTWEKVIQGSNGGNRQLYQQLLNELQSHTELLQPVVSEEDLKTHASVIERILATLFPVTLSDDSDVFAVLQPFNQKVLYASTQFRRIFVQDSNGLADAPPEQMSHEELINEKVCGAYQLILNQLYNVQIKGEMTSIHHFVCPQTHLDKYMELTVDAQFIDVKLEGELPEFNINQLNLLEFHDVLKNESLVKNVPLDRFRFDGFVILRIHEVTEREIINKIKSNLLNIHSFADEKIFGELDYQMQNLAGVHQLHTAIKPFFMVNNHLVLSEIITTNKTAKKYSLNEEQQYEIYQNIVSNFTANPEVIVVSDINQVTLERYPFLEVLYEHNFKSVIVAPLFNSRRELLGILIVAHRMVTLGLEHLARIRPAIPLFAIALEKSQENLDHQVDKVIKEQFTAVQEAVEWRFTKAALNYLTRKDKREQNVEQIVFAQVYPLYGAIDIRNSSTERNNAIQLDLLEQLQIASRIISKAQQLSNFPLLDELQFRIEKFTDSVSKILFAEEETTVHDFLTVEVIALMTHLKSILPELENDIAEYLQLIESPVRMLYHHRREYEESITLINTELAALIDSEQKQAQSIYPHYFERFVTDGLDYNIYVGQSITPRIPFNEFYLKNLKIWQLSVLVKAACLTNRLESSLALPLKTTQLILAHSIPISISFKTAERKFDVDGAYNMRYEIIKKRIDKVRIKDSNERLTQPGTVAIVYSQNKEAQEYLSYIEFLQSKGLLQDKVERLELEELQGISGLKGLRVAVNYGTKEEMPTIVRSEAINPMLIFSQA